MKYQKKPVVVEAIKCHEAMKAFEADYWQGLPEWLKDAYDKGGVVPTSDGIYLPTLEGSMLANSDDWIIQGVKGEVYPCKPDIFEETYEDVGQAAKEAKSFCGCPMCEHHTSAYAMQKADHPETTEGTEGV